MLDEQGQRLMAIMVLVCAALFAIGVYLFNICRLVWQYRSGCESAFYLKSEYGRRMTRDIATSILTKYIFALLLAATSGGFVALSWLEILSFDFMIEVGAVTACLTAAACTLYLAISEQSAYEWI